MSRYRFQSFHQVRDSYSNNIIKFIYFRHNNIVNENVSVRVVVAVTNMTKIEKNNVCFFILLYLTNRFNIIINS